MKRARLRWSETNTFEVELDVPDDVRDVFDYYYLGGDKDRTWSIEVLGERIVNPESVEVEFISDSVETTPRGFDE